MQEFNRTQLKIYLSKIHYLLKIKKLPITDIVIVVSGGEFLMMHLNIWKLMKIIF